MTLTYYIQEDDKIVLWDTDLVRLTNTLEFMPQYRDLDIFTTEDSIVDGVIYTQSEHESLEAEKREQDFKDTFIETSWGWYRKYPKGYSNAPQSIDIILNLVRGFGSFTDQLSDMMIFYSQPDFSVPEQCTEEWLVANQYKHEVDTAEAYQNFYNDFQIRWALDQHK